MFYRSKQRILRDLFIYLCYCSTTFSFILNRSSSNEGLRTRRSLLTNQIFLQDWPKLNSLKVKNDEIVIGCFQELDKNFLDHTITLTPERFSMKMGCPLRVPSNTSFKIIKTKVDDQISYFQIYSGLDRKTILHTSGKIRGGDGYTFGPFDDDYVLFHFRPTVASDFITFKLESS